MPSRRGLCFAVLALLLGGCSRRAPDVLLISVDTLRGDAVADMPFLARLGREGRSLPRVYAASTWTLPSHASLLLSRPYSSHRVPQISARPPFPGSALPPEATTLADAFLAAGYRTFATVEGGYVDRGFGFGRGFEVYDQLPALAHDPGADFGGHLAGLLSFVRGTAAEPVFAFVHTYRVHDYFLNLPRFQRFLLPEDEPWRARGTLAGLLHRTDGGEPPPELLHRLYRGAAAETDALLAALVDRVLAADRSRRWLVVVTSDHGECFSREPRLRTHGTAIVEDQIRVPWIAWAADGSLSGGAVAPLASGIDVAPSILGWAGLAVPSSFLGRRDLLAPRPVLGHEPIETAFFAYRERTDEELQLAMIEADQALLRIVAVGRDEETPLRRRGDKDGRSDWIADEGGGSPLLRRLAKARIRAWTAAGEESGRPVPEVDAELAAELEALGYL